MFATSVPQLQWAMPALLILLVLCLIMQYAIFDMVADRRDAPEQAPPPPPVPSIAPYGYLLSFAMIPKTPGAIRYACLHTGLPTEYLANLMDQSRNDYWIIPMSVIPVTKDANEILNSLEAEADFRWPMGV